MDKDQDENQNPTTTNSDSPRGSWQDRVHQLTRRASEAEQVASQAAVENTQLREQLNRLESQISQLSSRQVPAASEKRTFDLSGADKSGNFEELTAAIRQEVLGVVKPVLDEIQQGKADTQLAAAQRTSFQKAVKAHPELKDPESPLFQVFERLWDNRPDLQRVEGAPELLVEAARGILADARTTDQVRKMAANVDAPRNPRKLDVVDDTKDVSNALDQLVDVGKKEGWGEDEFGDYLALKFKQAGYEQR